jgi:hypothetical protein
MKYAFVIGSNAFIVPSHVIVYRDQNKEKEFLRINSVYHDLSSKSEQTFLDIDLYINDTDGAQVSLVSDKLVAGANNYHILKEHNFVKVLRADGSLLIHIHQLDDEAAMGLEHNITAEFEVNTPIVVIRITGEFLLGGLDITAQNEKLYINEIGYGNSVLAGTNQLKFTAEGVVL